MAALVGDRSPDLAGVSAPVFGPGDVLCGALTLTCPASRYREDFRVDVLHAARMLTQALGGTFPESIADNAIPD
ncbi:hypothetical protein D3C87_2145800 [compost metagenome]